MLFLSKGQIQICAEKLFKPPSRSKHKWHSKHPRPKIMDRRIFEAVTIPVYPEMLQPKEKPCKVKIDEARTKDNEVRIADIILKNIFLTFENVINFFKISFPL